MVLLRTRESGGTERISWKLRVAIPLCQNFGDDRDLLDLDAEICGMTVE